MEREKIKILYIITKSNWGGAQRYVFDLATHLPKETFEPIVAFGGQGPLKTKLESTGVQTISIPELERDIGILKEFRAFAGIFKIIKNVRPDIVHLNSSKAGLLGGLASRLYNIYVFFFNLLNPKPYPLNPSGIIFTAHGWAFKEKRRAVVRKLIEYGSWLTIALSHKTIVVSRDDLEKVKHFIFIQPKINLVHNGIETPNFTDQTEDRKIIAEKIGREIPKNVVVIGTIAELTKNKGLDYAIQAMKTVSNCLYIIIGGGEDKEKLQKIIDESGLREKVFLAGQIENASSLLKTFDIFLLPSLKEGLPYALLEAGFAELPVIATNVGGITEIIDDMKSGIVIKAKRSKEISEALAFLMEYPEKMKEFGTRLAKTVSENFTLEQMVEKTIAVYKNN